MKNKFYALLALATCLSASCGKEYIDNNLSDQSINFVSGVNKFETRINESGDQWLKDDEVGIFMLSENGSTTLKSNIKYTAVSAGVSTAFQTTEDMYYPTDGSSVRFMAYHPYSESATTYYPVDLSAQTNQMDLDLMFASGTQSYNQSQGANVSLTFNHVLVKVVLNLTAEAGVGDIATAKVTAKGMNTTAKFNFSTKAIENEGGADDIQAYQSTTVNRYELILLPVTELTSSHLVEFAVNGSTYSWTINNNDGGIAQFKAGHKYTFNINLTDSGVESEVIAEQGGSVAPWNPEEGSGTATPDTGEGGDVPSTTVVTTVDELLAAIDAASDGATIYLDPSNPYHVNSLSVQNTYTSKSISINKSITLEGTSASVFAYINAKAIEVTGYDIDLTIRNIEFGGYSINEVTGVPTGEVTSTSLSYFIDITTKGSVNNLIVENCFVHGIYNGVIRANRAADSLYGNVTISNNRFYNIGGNNGGFVVCHADGTTGGTWTIRNNTVTGIGMGFYVTGNENKKTLVFPKKANTINATISNNTFFGITSGDNNYFIDSADAASDAGRYTIEKNIMVFSVVSRGPRLGTGSVTISDNAIYPGVWTNLAATYVQSNTVAVTTNPFGVVITELVALDADFTPEATLKANGWGDSRWLK